MSLIIFDCILENNCSCRQSFLQTSSIGHISAPRPDFPTILRAEMMPKPRCSEFRSKFRVFCSITPNSEQNSEFGVIKNSVWGEKMKILKSNFWQEKYINMGPQYTKRCRIATFGGVCFLKKK